MKYILHDKINDTKTEYSSLAKIARDVDAPYSTVRKSYFYDINPDLKKGIKASQKQFDLKFEVTVAKW